MENYDVIVAGGGPAGSTTARLLTQTGRRVLLLERDRFPRHHSDAGLEPSAEPWGEAGLPVVTEVMAPDQVEAVCAHADMLQVGTRNMQNFQLLGAVGASHKSPSSSEG